METAESLEHPTLKARYECLNKAVRGSYKLVDGIVSQVSEFCSDMKRQRSQLSKEEAIQSIDAMVNKIKDKRRKLSNSKEEEEKQVGFCRARLNHLSVSGSDEWNEKRLDRILVDHLMRNERYDTALKLAETSNLHDLVDIDIFMGARKVVEGLRNNDCSLALAWCQENKSRLRKLKSDFEFQLRLQEFIELARNGKAMEAISYSKKHLSPNATTYLHQIQHAMGLLAFRSSTSCPRYQRLYDSSRWDALIEQFLSDTFALHSLPGPSLLAISLEAGLAALKTSFCYDEEETNRNLDCPICQPSFGKLAEGLPFSHHIHSRLVCRISGDIMDEDNPPIVLPNGMVYSQDAIASMTEKGMFVCPRTQEAFHESYFVKAFIS